MDNEAMVVRALNWSRNIEECRNSGMTVKDWCGERGIPTSTYFQWQRTLRKRLLKNPNYLQSISTANFAEIDIPKQSNGHVINRN